MRGIADQRSAENMISGRFSTVEQCISTLTEVERHRNSVGKTQAILKLRQIEEQQTEPQPKIKAKGSLPQNVPAQVAVVAQSSPREKDLGQEVTQLKKQLADLQKQISREPRGSRTARVEYPSEEHPCKLCGSPEHWQWRCPQLSNKRGPNKQSKNGPGLDPGSGGQFKQ